jgi:O-antigen/teichoic acid export membrane protein
VNRRLLRFTGGYGLSVVISGVISIAVIPAVIIFAGTEAWATIAVAQAVAGFAFVVAVFGWGVTGPTTVAVMDDRERGRFYLDSLLSRLWLCVPILPVAVIIAIPVSRGDPALAAVTVVTGVLAALGGGWFYVGESSPIRFLLLDSLPRNVGTVMGALALMATGDALWFALLQGVGVVAATVLTTWDILRRYPGWTLSLSPRPAFGNLRGHSASVTMSVTSSLYVNVPVILVGIFIPQATASYALAERIVRLALYSTRPIVQVAQGYVPSRDMDIQVFRARRVAWVSLLLGGVGALGYALLGPWAGSILSGGTLSIPLPLAVAMGINLGALLASQLTGFACMNAFGLTKALAVSTIVGAVVGSALMIPLTLLFGVSGLAFGLAAAEVSVLAVQLIVLRPFLRVPRLPRTEAVPGGLPDAGR